MRHTTIQFGLAAALLALLLPALAADPGSDAKITEDSTCHTNDSQDMALVTYTCLVRSNQRTGEDLSTPEARSKHVIRHLSSVCIESRVLSQEHLAAKNDATDDRWRLTAECKLFPKA